MADWLEKGIQNGEVRVQILVWTVSIPSSVLEWWVIVLTIGLLWHTKHRGLVCSLTHTDTHKHTHSHTHTHTHTHTHRCTHIHTYTHTHTHAHTHTHTLACTHHCLTHTHSHIAAHSHSMANMAFTSVTVADELRVSSFPDRFPHCARTPA